MEENLLFPVLTGMVISYIIGSFPTSLLAGKILKGIDIRNHGSGNAGATNVLRILGWKPGLIVILIDILKGWIPAFFFIEFFQRHELNDDGILKILFGFCSVLGHSYTIFANFKGGKGVGTLLGMLIALFPIAIPLCLLMFITIVIITGYVSLGSIFASISLPVFILVLPIFEIEPPHFSLIIFSLLIPFFILFTHRSNITRLRNGSENQFKRFMIFSKH